MRGRRAKDKISDLEHPSNLVISTVTRFSINSVNDSVEEQWSSKNLKNTENNIFFGSVYA